MARRDFPLSINRRRLLTSAAAAATATGILPGLKRAAAAAAPDLFQSPPLTLEVEPGNFCAATARRLVEIALRNELRREAKLPLLSVPKELRRMKKQEELEEFDRFEAAYGKAVWEEVLKARREAEGNPNWRPNWMEGGVSERSLQDSPGAICGSRPVARGHPCATSHRGLPARGTFASSYLSSFEFRQRENGLSLNYGRFCMAALAGPALLQSLE